MTEKYTIVFIHSPTDKHLGHFQSLATVNCPAINMGLQVSCRWYDVFKLFGEDTQERSSWEKGKLFLNFRGIAILILIVVVLIYSLTNDGKVILFPYDLASIWVFNDNHSPWSKVRSQCCFDFHFSSGQRCWNFLPCTYFQFVLLLLRGVYSYQLPFILIFTSVYL